MPTVTWTVAKGIAPRTHLPPKAKKNGCKRNADENSADENKSEPNCKGNCKLDLAKTTRRSYINIFGNNNVTSVTHLAGGPKRIR